jgi:protein involved in temperature-dependent protein secretion
MPIVTSWLGKSYEMFADIRSPLLGLRASVKARLYLAKALQLARDNKDYRHELFQLLIVSDHSPGALPQAENILQMTPQTDPDYPFMLMRFARSIRHVPLRRVESAVLFLSYSNNLPA